MQAVLALRGVARRRSGLMVLVMLAAVVVLPKLATLLPSEQALREAHVAGARQHYYYYTTQHRAGWEYYGFLMDGQAAPPPPQPQLGNGRENSAGLGTALEDRRQDDPALAGIQLASGRKPHDAVEDRKSEGNVKADTLDSGSAQPGVQADTGRTSAAATPVTASPDLTARDTTAFHRLIASHGGPASYPGTRLSLILDTTRIREPWAKSLPNRRWYASDPHPFLASVLPGVSFAAVSTYNYPVSPPSLCAITSDGRVYGIRDLNSLLLAKGYSFDSTELQTIAKIAVLVAYFMSPPRGKTWNPSMATEHPLNPCRLGAAAFPSIEFRSFLAPQIQTRDEWGPSGTRITVVSSIDGVPETTAVAFRRIFGARMELDRVVALRKPILMFNGGRASAPRTILQGSLSIPDRTGIVWHELNVGVSPLDTYHFVCVQKNGTPTHDSVQFVVSGWAAGDSYELLRRKLQSDSLLPVFRRAMNGYNCDTFTWDAGDTVGQFHVWARRKLDTTNMTNVAFLDVEAQISLAEANGKWLKLHYEEANGQDTKLSSKELAESLEVALDSAWDIEVPWLQGDFGDTILNSLDIEAGTE
jgi:hypothetical protein